MKKMILAALLVAALGTSAFAADVNKVNSRVLSSFESKFANAEHVLWTSRETYNKVTFTVADEKVEAFFAVDGDLIGYSRKADFKSLPLNAIQKIKKDYKNYNVTETIEFTQNEEKAYYVSLENGDNKLVLEVSLYGNVSKYHGAVK
jgi:opacity protein-like surface antigen